MTNGNGAAGASSEPLVNLICQEWPALERARVSELLPEGDKLTSYVAEQTKHTRALVSAHLAELRDVASGRGRHDETHRISSLVARLEERAEELLRGARGDLARTAKESVEKNLWLSLGIAALFGVIFGFLLRGGGRDR